MKVTCKFCKKETGNSRHLSVTGTSKGVFHHILCEHCGEMLVVQTRDKNVNPITPRVV